MTDILLLQQDHATVGAVLGTLLTTTLLLKRASTINTIFGGASLGLAGGTITLFVLYFLSCFTHTHI